MGWGSIHWIDLERARQQALVNVVINFWIILSYICNKSILSGTFPTRLKYAIVKPLLNKGDRKDGANYRPISLLTSFSKVFEKNYIKQTFKTH